MREDDRRRHHPSAFVSAFSLLALGVVSLSQVCPTATAAGQDAVNSGQTPSSKPQPAKHRVKLRGAYFNPQIRPSESYFPWLRHYDKFRSEVNKELVDLVDKTGINFICIQLLIADTMKDRAAAPHWGPAIADWADTSALDHLVAFLGYCHTLGVSVEIDLANNMWIPFTVDRANHIANREWWPKPSATPWVESVTWYTQVIEYVERKTRHPESIAFWDMFANYQFGGAEPILWDMFHCPDVTRWTEAFVKHVWPAFRKAGRRPKGAPIMLPILSNSDYWLKRSPMDRISAVSNLKRWLVDDLKMPPDYWVMTTYLNSDPATDGFCYLKAVVDILGRENAGRIISTDFKGPGHDLSDAIVDTRGMTGAEMLKWHFDKVDEYGLGGWWFWSYRDTATDRTGIRDVHGRWKESLVDVIRQRTARLR